MANVKVETKWLGEEVKKRAALLMTKTSFEIGLTVEAQAKELAPIKSGRLAGSIHTRSWDGQQTSPRNADDTISKPNEKFETYVGTSLEYAPYMEYGAMPYAINKTVMIPGVGFRYIGMHPGYEAQPYLRPALDIARGKVPSLVEKNGKIYFEEYLK